MLQFASDEEVWFNWTKTDFFMVRAEPRTPPGDKELLVFNLLEMVGYLKACRKGLGSLDLIPRFKG
jgi:hypothetical protein